jgi:nucleoprotein TPR
VWKLELDILPLKEANAELSEKSGMLQAKKLLEEDIKRWKALNQVNEIKAFTKHGSMLS